MRRPLERLLLKLWLRYGLSMRIKQTTPVAPAPSRSSVVAAHSAPSQRATKSATSALQAVQPPTTAIVSGVLDRGAARSPGLPAVLALQIAQRVEQPQAATMGIVDAADGPFDITTTDQKGRSVSFRLTLAPEVATLFSEAGWQLDLKTGEIVNGEARQDLIGLRHAYRARYHVEPPGWMFMEPLSGEWGPPRGTAHLTMEGTRVSFALPEGQQMAFRTLRNDRDLRREASSTRSQQPLTSASLGPTTRLELSSSVTVIAQTPALAQAARAAYDDVVGKAAAVWPARRAALKVELSALFHLEELVSSGEDDAVRAAVADFASRLGAGDGALWTRDDALAAIEARRCHIRRIGSPIEIIVVPAGHHYAVMPQLDHMRDLIETIPNSEHLNGACVFDGHKHFVMIPEEDLVGSQGTTRHELHHVLEDLHLPDEVLRFVDGYHQDMVQNDGVFPRAYGLRRREFMTTMGEEFEGVNGPPGPRWLQENHPMIYEIFANATGRRP